MGEAQGEEYVVVGAAAAMESENESSSALEHLKQETTKHAADAAQGTEMEKETAAPTVEDEVAFTLLIKGPEVTEPIRLEHVSAADTVLSLRQLIAEYPSLACYTCYHLEADDEESKTTYVLNDFVELGEYEAIKDGVTLRMVLEKYDARKVRAHVRRFRDVLMNPPIPQTGDGADGMPEKATEKKTKLKQDKSADETSGNEVNTKAEEKKKKEFTERQLKHLREIHEKLENVKIPIEADLSDFYSPAELTCKNDTKNKSELAQQAKLPECIKSIVFSGYNPPPGPRKLVGDLLYLEVTTEDDMVYHVTAHVNGFYVNRSTMTTFDPLPHKNACQSHLLLDVLLKASAKFQSSYTSLLSKAASLVKQGPASIELMVAAGNNVGGKLPWNVPVVEDAKHEYNLNRAEDELCTSYGMDERGVLRDWNEEYQCCRELPSTTLKEQIVRSRVMYKIVSEFVESATQGAVAIVEGHIPPINPMDDESAHVYVFNNIFFSLAIDGKASTKDAGEEAAYSSSNRDLQGVKAFNEADIKGLHTLATTIVDYLGVRVVAQSVIPGILQGEAASKLVYGSVDAGKSIASNEKIHALMVEAGKKLHIAERRIKPLGLDKDNETAKEAPVVGGEAGTVTVSLCGPVEAKGILGSDGRMYVLDLVRITPKDWTYYAKDVQRDQETEGLHFNRQDEGYTALLRPELVQLFSMWRQNQIRKDRKEEALRKIKEQQEAEKKEKEQEEGKAEVESEKKEKTEKEREEEAAATLAAAAKALEQVQIDENIPPVLLNPNVFMEYDACVDEVIAKADEQDAKGAADYLQKVVIPAFVADIRRGSISPVDGCGLTDLMHSCGINMRYLGRLGALVKKLEAVSGISKYVLELLETEMIARAAKHILADVLNTNESIRAAPGAVLVQFLNGMFGSVFDKDSDEDVISPSSATKNKSKKTNKKSRKKAKTPEVPTSSVNVVELPGFDRNSIWERIDKEIKNRFDYELTLWNQPENPEEDEQILVRVHKNPLLRRICQRLGLRVLSRDYDFNTTTPFMLSDMQGVIPVVKHSLPNHPLPQAKQLLERGRLHLGGGALASAYELLQESSALLYQVCGSAHEDAALCTSSLATVLYHAGDIPGAISQQQRALALYTQLNGVDYHDTAFAHANLALFLHANGQTDSAVSHLRRAIYLLELCSGPYFPEISSLYFKLGMMCQDVGQITLALLAHRESLRRGEFDRLQAANTLHQMALACGLAGGYREALAYEKKVYALYEESFGEKDQRTMESVKFMAKFTEKAVEGAKGRREIDAAAAADKIASELLEELELNEQLGKKRSKKSKHKVAKQ